MRSRPFLASLAPSLRMPEQLWLPDFDPAPQIHRLFLALLPDTATAASLALLAERLRAKHGLRNPPLLTEHFHLSLYWLNEDVTLRTDIIERANDVAATLRTPPFTVTLDRVISFKRNQPAQAFVLRENQENAPLHTFHRDLGAALARAGLGRGVKKTFRPHVTLLYDPHSVPEQPVAPVSWTVNEFVLIESLIGQTRHIVHGRWPLRG